VAFLEGAKAALAAVHSILGSQELPVVTLLDDEEGDSARVAEATRLWLEVREKYSEIIEKELREPIEASVLNSMNALNFLEDTELGETAHELIHKAAALRFGFLGCKLWMEGDQVKSDCPVRVGHLRWGMSPELVTEWACSICALRVDVCPHIPGEDYEVVVDRSNSNCSACKTADCAHQHGGKVQMKAHPVAVSIQTLAVAVVARPRDPTARVAELPLEPSIVKALLQEIEAGNGCCRECLLPCTGFTEHESLR
jgi:hypothetical protein